jgi:hypothetical protein
MLIFPTLYKKRKQKGKSKYIANSAEIEQAGGGVDLNLEVEKL